jgi:telomerase reverse transcriptase
VNCIRTMCEMCFSTICHVSVCADILMRLDPARSGAGKVLYQYIFKSWLNSVALKWSFKKPKHLSPFPKYSPVPKKHHYMLPWLAQLIKNAQKCQFGALLRAHCPLPLAFLKYKNENTLAMERPREPLNGPRPLKRPRSASPTPPLTKSEDNDGRPPKRMTRLGKLLEEAKSQVHCSQVQSEISLTGDIPDLSTSFVPHAHVVSFVWAVIRHIIPKQLLGGPMAQKQLRKALTKFIGLKRFETMTAHQAMQKMPLSELTWLDTFPANMERISSPPNSTACKYRMACLWIGWLFSSIVVPTLRNHFYCTENEAYRQQVFYYRKPVWSAMVDKALKETLSSTFLPVKQQVAKAALEKRTLGVSRLRFLPKRAGLRFLVNMSRKSVARFPSKTKKHKALGTKSVTPSVTKTFNPINASLKYTLNVLQCEANRQPEAFGSSTYGFNDIYCSYKPFVKQWRSDRVREISKNPDSLKDIIRDFGPHAVCVDVSRAFDNVDVRTLMSVISSLITAEEYTIFKFTEIITVMGTIRVKFRNVAVPSKDMKGHDISHYISSLSNGQKDRIFLDCITSEKIKRSKIMENLDDYLSLNLIKLKKKWRYQGKGIAQGGKPSTILCSLYLGYIERVCFDPLIASCGVDNACIGSHGSVKENLTSLTAMGMVVTPGGGTGSYTTLNRDSYNSKCPHRSHTMLIRLVDDWILISRHKDVAEQFAARILQGIPGFNIKVNPSKTQITFPILDIPNIGVLRQNIYEEADGTRYIKWCGLLVDIQTLELRADYTRYCGEHVGISLNIPVSRNPGTMLSSKLCHYMRPKLLPVLLDQEINTPLNIRINLYQIFLLGAMKLHCFLSGLACPPNKDKSSGWIISAIKTGIRYVADSTRPRRIFRLAKTNQSELCNPGLPRCHVEYLGYHAFYTVLKRKQSRYPELLQELVRELHEPSCRKCEPHLQEAINPLHSAIFDSIIF